MYIIYKLNARPQLKASVGKVVVLAHLITLDFLKFEGSPFKPLPAQWKWVVTELNARPLSLALFNHCERINWEHDHNVYTQTHTVRGQMRIQVFKLGGGANFYECEARGISFLALQ